MSTWDGLRTLPLSIGEVATSTLRLPLGEWTRKTTVVELRGGGETGVGEDVTYDANEHEERFPRIDLAGEWTLESLSAHLETVELFPAGPPAQHAYLDYRRWALESAALDLALRQGGTTLAEALGASPRARDVRRRRHARRISTRGSSSIRSCASSSTRRRSGPTS